MKIPSSIRIHGVDYDVEYVENLRDSSKILYAEISYTDCKIRISSTDGKAHDFMCQSLWHEIVHAILDNAGITPPEDEVERIVEILAKGIYQVIKDNEKALFPAEAACGLSGKDEFKKLEESTDEEGRTDTASEAEEHGRGQSAGAEEQKQSLPPHHHRT